jgi:succinyl-CoA synthetase alpha subunit
MSILIDEQTRVIVQGITGGTARTDVERCLKTGTRIVAGVSPGRGGEEVHGVPVYDTVAAAVREHPADASAIYVPASSARDAVMEALDSELKLLLVTAEYVPSHDILYIAAAARAAGAQLIGCNTNGIISPGKSRIGGIGGIDPDEIYAPGFVGVCSRSGGMSAEIALVLKAAGLGISTCVSMGGDSVTGLRMVDYAALFEADPDTQAIVVFGEPGTANEQQLAKSVVAGEIRKPVIALIVGTFQEKYPKGMTFGHAAAMISTSEESATAKRTLLRQAGVHVCDALDQIPDFIRSSLASGGRNGGGLLERVPRPQQPISHEKKRQGRSTQC